MGIPHRRLPAAHPVSKTAPAPGEATLFLERNSPSDLQRNIAGGDGPRRHHPSLCRRPTIFGALSYTGNKIADGAKAFAAAGATVAPNFDEQQAVVGRLSWLPISTPDVKWLIGVNGTYVLPNCPICCPTEPRSNLSTHAGRRQSPSTRSRFPRLRN